MSANSYVEKIAKAGIVRQLEKVNVTRSLGILQQRINEYFQAPGSCKCEIKRHFPFGSFTRGTILPRNMDPQSDVDYMVVFSDADSKPQSSLDRLRRFADKCYKSAEISQRHPTIVLTLNHIKFELVPAIETMFSGVKIPTKSSMFSDWVPTSPLEFNKDLIEKNKGNGSLTKPLIRLVKYWNACSGYPFEAFRLEQRIVSHWTLATAFSCPSLWKRLRDFINAFDTASFNMHQKSTVERAQRVIAEVKALESQRRINDAERSLKQFLPDVR